MFGVQLSATGLRVALLHGWIEHQVVEGYFVASYLKVFPLFGREQDRRGVHYFIAGLALFTCLTKRLSRSCGRTTAAAVVSHAKRYVASREKAKGRGANRLLRMTIGLALWSSAIITNRNRGRQHIVI